VVYSIDAGATFVLGSEASVGSTGTISGGVHGTNAASVQIHGANINGGLRLRGGSGLGSAPLATLMRSSSTTSTVARPLRATTVSGSGLSATRSTAR
jgi:hypothetical protein